MRCYSGYSLGTALASICLRACPCPIFGGKLSRIVKENKALQFQRLQSAEAADESSEQIRSVEYSQLREWSKFSYFTHFESGTTFDIPKQL